MPGPRFLGVFLVAWCAIVVPSAVSRAQDVAAATSAEQLIEEGIALRREGDDQGALAAFARAYAASRSPRAAAQLGLAHQALGQWVEAHARLREALGATSDAWVTRNGEALAQALAVVEAEVGSVEILLSGDAPEGTRVTVGGREVGSLPMTEPLVVVAGEEVVEASAPGRRTVRREVRVRAGQLSRVTIELLVEPTAAVVGPEVSALGEVSAAATTTPAEDRAAPPSDDEWIVWVIVGAVAAVGVGVAVAVLVSQQSVEPPLPGSAGTVELLRW